VLQACLLPPEIIAAFGALCEEREYSRGYSDGRLARLAPVAFPYGAGSDTATRAANARARTSAVRTSPSASARPMSSLRSTGRQRVRRLKGSGLGSRFRKVASGSANFAHNFKVAHRAGLEPACLSAVEPPCRRGARRRFPRRLALRLATHDSVLYPLPFRRRATSVRPGRRVPSCAAIRGLSAAPVRWASLNFSGRRHPSISLPLGGRALPGESVVRED
jgi:hypothetical protein